MILIMNWNNYSKMHTCTYLTKNNYNIIVLMQESISSFIRNQLIVYYGQARCIHVHRPYIPEIISDDETMRTSSSIYDESDN